MEIKTCLHALTRPSNMVKGQPNRGAVMPMCIMTARSGNIMCQEVSAVLSGNSWSMLLTIAAKQSWSAVHIPHIMWRFKYVCYQNSIRNNGAGRIGRSNWFNLHWIRGLK